ncbi:hypothetical protein [Bacillus velezensis]|uniref:hypothetical protein n=1 Tax=Bacillus velezensis TaxID=492670 RepID=UPI003EBCF578
MKNNFKVEFEDISWTFLGSCGDAIGWPQEDRSIEDREEFQTDSQFQKWYEEVEIGFLHMKKL